MKLTENKPRATNMSPGPDKTLAWIIFAMVGLVFISILSLSMNYAEYSPSILNSRFSNDHDISQSLEIYTAQKITPTPFMPLSVSEIIIADAPVMAAEEPDEEKPPEEEQPTEAQVLPPSLDFFGISLENNDQRVTIEIIPKNNSVNQGKSIILTFYPGRQCNFGDGNACVNTYRTDSGSNVIFLSLHSGVGGEGQSYRHAIEGTGINRARYPLEIVIDNLQALEGSKVLITQGEKMIAGMELVGTGRVPATSLAHYLDAPLQDAIRTASSNNPSLAGYVNPESPQIIFETCGWKMPSEPWAPGVSSTTASIYLGVIQMASQ